MTPANRVPVAWFMSSVGTRVPLWRYEAADRLSRETPHLVVWEPGSLRSH